MEGTCVEKMGHLIFTLQIGVVRRKFALRRRFDRGGLSRRDAKVV